MSANESELLSKIEAFEKAKKTKLSNWHRAWFVANLGKEINTRPPEFVFQVMQIRRSMQRIINDKIFFCLVDPERTSRMLSDLVGDYMSAFQEMTMQPKEENAEVRKNLLFGIAGGNKNSKKFDDWFMEKKD